MKYKFPLEYANLFQKQEGSWGWNERTLWLEFRPGRGDNTWEMTLKKIINSPGELSREVNTKGRYYVGKQRGIRKTHASSTVLVHDFLQFMKVQFWPNFDKEYEKKKAHEEAKLRKKEREKS